MTRLSQRRSHPSPTFASPSTRKNVQLIAQNLLYVYLLHRKLITQKLSMFHPFFLDICAKFLEIKLGKSKLLLNQKSLLSNFESSDYHIQPTPLPPPF